MAKYRVDTAGGSYIVETDDAAPSLAQMSAAMGGGSAPDAGARMRADALGKMPQQDNSVLARAGRFATGFDVAAGNALPGLAQTVAHPIDAYVADSKRRAQILEQAKTDAAAGHYGAAVDRGSNAFIPFLGPVMEDATNAIHDDDLSSLGGAAFNLVSAEALPEAGRLTGEAMRAVPGAAPVLDAAGQTVRDSTQFAVQRAADAANKVADVAGRVPAAAADALRTSAEKNINTAINPTTKVNKALVRDQLAQGLVDRGVVAKSLQDLQDQAQAKMDLHGGNIDAIFDQHAEAGTKLDPQPILDALEAEKQRYTVAGVSLNDAYVDRLKAFQKQVKDVSDQNGGDIPVGDLRRMKQVADETVAQSKGGFALPPDAQSQVAATKTFGNSIRSTFSDSVPELTPDSKEFNFWANVDKVTDASLLRKTGQRAPLTQKLGEFAGGVVGGYVGGWPGALIGKEAGGLLGKMKNSTAWNTLSAQAKVRIANLIDAGDEGGAMMVFNRAGSAPAAAPAIAQAATTPSATAQAAAVPRAAASPETTIPVPGQAGPGYAAQYKLRELADLQASHNGQTFQPNPKYQLENDRDYANAVNQGKIVQGASRVEFDPARLINDNPDATNGPPVVDTAGNVLGGNGRKMILDRVASGNPAGAAAYKALLTSKAGQFGLDAGDVAKMKSPVLVREVPDAAFGNGGKQAAITDLNKTGTAALTPGERATADSRRVSDSTLDHIGTQLEKKGDDSTIAQVLEGDGGKEVLRRLIKDGAISSNERAALADEDGLTKEGRERISQLMIGRYFADANHLDTISDTVRNKVARASGPLAKAEGLGANWSLTPNVRQALEIVSRAQKLGIKNVDDFISQDGLFAKQKYSEQAITLARAFARMKSGELTGALQQYAADAAHASKGDTMFAAAPTQQEVFRGAFPGDSDATPGDKALNALFPKKPAPANSLARKNSD